MNPQTCPDSFCGGSLRNGACMACGRKYQDVEITLTDCNGKALDLDGVTWPVVVSPESLQSLKSAFHDYHEATGHAASPILVIESPHYEKWTDNLMDIHGTRHADTAAMFEKQRQHQLKQALNPARYTYPEAKRRKRR